MKGQFKWKNVNIKKEIAIINDLFKERNNGLRRGLKLGVRGDEEGRLVHSQGLRGGGFGLSPVPEPLG